MEMDAWGAGLPAAIQLLLMVFLPKSARWLYRNEKVEEACSILEKIFPSDELKNEIQEFRNSMETEITEKGSIKHTYSDLIKKEIRLALIAGVGLHVFQQFVGMNTVMYYSPSMFQMAGFGSNSVALLLPLIVAGMNALGTIAGMYLIERAGRWLLAMSSLSSVILALAVLSTAFHMTTKHGPAVSEQLSSEYGNSTCPAILESDSGTLWMCKDCLNVDCGFCAKNSQKELSGAFKSLQQTLSRLVVPSTTLEDPYVLLLHRVKDAGTFIARFLDIHGRMVDEGVKQIVRLGLHRSDYMADMLTGDLLQIEINTISSSFAGLSAQVTLL